MTGGRNLPDLEREIAELERQVPSIAAAGTDFAIRLDRRSTTLISAVEELRASAEDGAHLLQPDEFWSRTASAVTALTAIRAAARSALR